ncbi:Gfo/Idh/MocA family protein [Paenibacillus thermotolerans]|uniref:Gfo/Idh/MocA family protein n=1 Tax=Paenibacillus thermotolerans TaxID=3027807 RepID=UPI0023683B1A|nr:MULTISPECIES: Gfo/Idh/MocA family oxidoreductase [unclassified Paenibacillus]
MKKLRWGVLGTGKIIQKTGVAIRRTTNGVWFGVAGRNVENGRKAAEAFGVERAYDGYQALIDDPEIDAVYIALLNHLHMEWAVKAANAGKHVLLEKPFALNMREALAIRSAAEGSGVQIAEAHAWRYHPGHAGVKKMVEEGRIGELTMMHAHFSFAADAASTRLVKEWGGGSLYDVGCYPVAWSRYFMGEEPTEAEGKAFWDERTGVDRRFAGALYFSGGKVSHISSALDMKLGSFYSLLGSEGKIDVRFDVTPDQLTIRAQGPSPSEERTWATDRIQFYTDQAEEFAACVLKGEAHPYGIGDAIHNQKAIDALFLSDAENQRIVL